jgi:hypothetical protein
MPIEFPITVNAIEYADTDYHRPKLLFGGQCGDMVASGLRRLLRPYQPRYCRTSAS